MSRIHLVSASCAVILGVALGGCGLVAPHIDCDQVAQQQRSGTSKEDIAASMGFSVADVESCSSTPKREASYSNYERPLMPRNIPNITAGSVAAGSVSGVPGR